MGVCKIWANSNAGGNPGYDAVDLTSKLGPSDKRYQIKSRHPEKKENVRVDTKGTTPSFTSLEFDWALLVLMDKDLQNYEIWRADRTNVERNLRPGRKDIKILQFQKIGTCIYP